MCEDAVTVAGLVRDCCAKGSCVGSWIPLILQTKPSIKWEPDSSVGFSLRLLTVLNPQPSLWTHPPSCAVRRPALSPRPSNGSDFYYPGWWDIHKETLCQHDGKRVSPSVLIRLLERSLKSNRASGSPLCSRGDAVWHHLAGGNWWRMHGCDRFIILVSCNFLPHEHLCMSFPMTHLWAAEPLQEAHRDQSLSLAVPAARSHTMDPAGWRIAALRQEKPLFALTGSDTCDCRRKVSGIVLCIVFSFFSHSSV